MTTLDYTKYFKNLKEHSFSDSLIEMENRSYQDCVNNLEKVSYSEFNKN